VVVDLVDPVAVEARWAALRVGRADMAEVVVAADGLLVEAVGLPARCAFS
jgi:hypothetical protein